MNSKEMKTMATYDEWKSTEPDDPYADELELERRDAEMEPGEPDYPPEYEEWPELNDHADSLNIVTGEVEE